VAAVLLAAVLGLAAVTTHTGLAWIGRPFPGFLLLGNRVVASISLPSWPVATTPEVFQAHVVAVDGEPVSSSDQVYAHVRNLPVATRVAYRFVRHGDAFVRYFDTRLFGWSDALLLFGVYLLNGVLFAAIAIFVWMLSPQRATPWAVLAVGLCCGTYALTAIDLYGPYSFFRLHALAESFAPGVFLHLALVFPVRRVHGRQAALLTSLPCVPLAVVYQLWLASPVSYPVVHEWAIRLWLASAAAFLLAVIVGYYRSRSELVRYRVRFAVLGALSAFLLPTLALSSSLITKEQVPANVIAYFAFLFPLSLAYAVHKHDLFEIDALVYRGTYYALLSGLVTVTYLLLAAAGTQLFADFARSPIFSLLFTLAAVMGLPLLRERLQRLVDAIFGRKSYDVQEVLAIASTGLGATLSLDDILRLVVTLPSEVLQLAHIEVFLRLPNGFERVSPPAEAVAAGTMGWLREDHILGRLMIRRPSIVVRHTPAGDTREERAAVAQACDELGAELIVPLACQGTLTGFVVCGPKRSGAFFTAGDVSFLRTFANQAALSLQNARTYRDLEVLNADLERRVNSRTRELAASKDRLSTSLAQLEEAYRTLQARQEQLVSAEKMAAFGRLAANIAHEMNTPLGASLNGLKVAREMVSECAAVATDETTSDDERKSAFDELKTLIGNVEEWTNKAVTYIRSVKGYGRGGRKSVAAFDMEHLLDRDLQPLLMHRLRLAGGQLDLRLAADLPELHGDPARLGQVLANLINNAIDAFEGMPPDRRRITVEVLRHAGEVIIHVSDCGVGIKAQDRAHVFEEFYTTKPPGRGTGLGLSISREIVSAEFGGSLACTSTCPEGTTFTVRLPIRSAEAAATTERLSGAQDKHAAA
jgi:signal transduction histidine kinase